MHELLKIIHFLSFSAAIGAGLANILAAYRLLPLPPEAMPKAAAYRLLLLRITTVGLALLWLTGIAMLMTSNAPTFSNPLFLLKLLVVLLLTGVIVMANMAIARSRQSGTPPDAAKMKRLGLLGPALASLALILAILAFG